MLKKRALSSLLCGLLVLGCASAQAQEVAEEAESVPPVAEPPPTEVEPSDAVRAGSRAASRAALDQANALQQRRAQLERSVIPELRSQLAQLESDMADRARQIAHVQRSLQAELDTAARQHAQLVDRRDELTAQGLGSKASEMVRVERQLVAAQEQLNALRQHWAAQRKQLSEARAQGTSSLAAAQTALAAAQSELTVVADRIARIDPLHSGARPDRRGVLAERDARRAGQRGPRWGKSADPRARGPHAPHSGAGAVRGRPDADVRRRLDGLEEALREMRRLFERHGVAPEARERGERRVERRRDPQWRGRDDRPTAPRAEEPDRPFARSPAPPPRARDTQPEPVPGVQARARDVLSTLLDKERAAAPKRTGLTASERKELQELSRRLIELLDKDRASGEKTEDSAPEPGRAR